MRSITVAELRQNPTEALVAVEAGETYVVTKHRRPVAQLVPVEEPGLAPLSTAAPTAPTRLAQRPRWRLRTAASVDELIASMKSDW